MQALKEQIVAPTKEQMQARLDEQMKAHETKRQKVIEFLKSKQPSARKTQYLDDLHILRVKLQTAIAALSQADQDDIVLIQHDITKFKYDIMKTIYNYKIATFELLRQKKAGKSFSKVSKEEIVFSLSKDAIEKMLGSGMIVVPCFDRAKQPTLVTLFSDGSYVFGDVLDYEVELLGDLDDELTRKPLIVSPQEETQETNVTICGETWSLKTSKIYQGPTVKTIHTIIPPNFGDFLQNCFTMLAQNPQFTPGHIQQLSIMKRYENCFLSPRDIKVSKMLDHVLDEEIVLSNSFLLALDISGSMFWNKNGCEISETSYKLTICELIKLFNNQPNTFYECAISGDTNIFSSMIFSVEETIKQLQSGMKVVWAPFSKNTGHDSIVKKFENLEEFNNFVDNNGKISELEKYLSQIFKEQSGTYLQINLQLVKSLFHNTPFHSVVVTDGELSNSDTFNSNGKLTELMKQSTKSRFVVVSLNPKKPFDTSNPNFGLIKQLMDLKLSINFGVINEPNKFDTLMVQRDVDRQSDKPQEQEKKKPTSFVVCTAPVFVLGRSVIMDTRNILSALFMLNMMTINDIKMSWNNLIKLLSVNIESNLWQKTLMNKIFSEVELSPDQLRILQNNIKILPESILSHDVKQKKNINNFLESIKPKPVQTPVIKPVSVSVPVPVSVPVTVTVPVSDKPKEVLALTIEHARRVRGYSINKWPSCVNSRVTSETNGSNTIFRVECVEPRMQIGVLSFKVKELFECEFDIINRKSFRLIITSVDPTIPMPLDGLKAIMTCPGDGLPQVLSNYDKFDNINKKASIAVSHHGHLSGTMSEVTTVKDFQAKHSQCTEPNKIKLIYNADTKEFSVLRGGVHAFCLPVIERNEYFISIDATAGNTFNIKIPTANLHKYKNEDVLIELSPKVQSAPVQVQSAPVQVQRQVVVAHKPKSYVAPNITVIQNQIVQTASEFKIVFNPDTLEVSVKRTFIGEDVLGISDTSPESLKAIATTNNSYCILNALFWSLVNKDEKITELVNDDEDIFNALVMYIKLKYNVEEVISSVFISCLTEKKINVSINQDIITAVKTLYEKCQEENTQPWFSFDKFKPVFWSQEKLDVYNNMKQVSKILDEIVKILNPLLEPSKESLDLLYSLGLSGAFKINQLCPLIESILLKVNEFSGVCTCFTIGDNITIENINLLKGKLNSIIGDMDKTRQTIELLDKQYLEAVERYNIHTKQSQELSQLELRMSERPYNIINMPPTGMTTVHLITLNLKSDKSSYTATDIGEGFLPYLPFNPFTHKSFTNQLAIVGSRTELYILGLINDQLASEGNCEDTILIYMDNGKTRLITEPITGFEIMILNSTNVNVMKESIKILTELMFPKKELQMEPTILRHLMHQILLSIKDIDLQHIDQETLKLIFERNLNRLFKFQIEDNTTMKEMISELMEIPCSICYKLKSECCTRGLQDMIHLPNGLNTGFNYYHFTCISCVNIIGRINYNTCNDRCILVDPYTKRELTVGDIKQFNILKEHNESYKKFLAHMEHRERLQIKN